MQFTSKCILLAIALAYGSTVVSAAPVGESSLAARSPEYELEDLNAREIDEMELFVREPFSLFGFGTPSPSRAPATPSHETVDSHTGTGAGLSVSPFDLLRNFKLSDKKCFLVIENKVGNIRLS